MADLFGRWVAPAILALVPALFRLRRGRTMARHLDDPAFPERLQGSRMPITAVFAGVLAAEIVAWPGQTWWTLPLFLLSFVAAGWPLRRVMFAETWSVAAYVWFYVRLFVAIYGFWIVLMQAPWLTRFGGPIWLAPAIVALILVAWNEEHAAILRWILRARPIAPSGLLDRCREIVSRSQIANPNIEYVPMNGGVLINALALPHRRQSTVLFSSSLIDRFEEEEVAAVFAHEVAHLEHFNPRRLRKLRWVGWAMIAVAVTTAPLLHHYMPRFESFFWLWPLAVIAYISVLTSARQKHETESDLRAMALGSHPDALVRGLTKLYALARLPRRLDPNVEVNASHPSLARRIQAIRSAAGVTAASLAEPVVLQGGSTQVTLHPDRLVWAEADGTSHALPYATLNELRIEAGEGGAAKLSAGDAHGRRWTLRLADGDVARAQAALDVVDARLRPAPTGVGVWKTLGTLVSLLAALTALGAGQVVSALVALMAVISFERPLMRAAGAAGLVGAAIALRDGGRREVALMLMLSAVLLLFIATRDRREGVSRLTSLAIPLLGVLTLLTLVPMALGARGFLSAHQMANRWPIAAVLALAFAAAAAWPPRRRWRMASLAAAAIGAVVLVIGDTRTLDAVMDDPFLRKVGPPAAARLTGSPLTRITLDVFPEHVWLSPHAESLAVRVSTDDYEDFTYYIGRAGAKLVEIDADAARFVDDRRILIAVPDGANALLRLVTTDHPEVPIWEQRLPFGNPAIAVDRSGLQWRALGHDNRGRRFVRVSGAMSGVGLEEHEWAANPAPEAGAATPLSADGGRLLLSTNDYAMPGLSALSPWLYWLRPFSSETQFAVADRARITALFRSKLNVECEPGAFIEDGPICSAYDGSRFHLGVLATADGSVTPVAKFDRAMSFEVAPDWVTGWWNAPFALDRRNHRLVLIGDALRANRWPHMMAASEEAVAVVWRENGNGGQTILEIYPRSAIVDQ